MPLQVHAVDEVIGLLGGEGASLLQLVLHQTQPTAHHQQQEGADDDAQDQW